MASNTAAAAAAAAQLINVDDEAGRVDMDVEDGPAVTESVASGGGDKASGGRGGHAGATQAEAAGASNDAIFVDDDVDDNTMTFEHEAGRGGGGEEGGKHKAALEGKEGGGGASPAVVSVPPPVVPLPVPWWKTKPKPAKPSSVAGSTSSDIALSFDPHKANKGDKHKVNTLIWQLVQWKQPYQGSRDVLMAQVIKYVKDANKKNGTCDI
jgi:hypothetical protein